MLEQLVPVPRLAIVGGLDLYPLPGFVDAVLTPPMLRDDALQVLLADEVEELAAASFEVLSIEHRSRFPCRTKNLLAIGEPELADVLSIDREDIESNARSSRYKWQSG